MSHDSTNKKRKSKRFVPNIRPPPGRMEKLLTIYDPKIIRDIDFIAKDIFTQKRRFWVLLTPIKSTPAEQKENNTLENP